MFMALVHRCRARRAGVTASRVVPAATGRRRRSPTRSASPCASGVPGNRGLTYHVRPGTTVRAAAAGIVTFSGVVAGTRYVVVIHADGLRATYGGLSSSALDAGDAVAAGAVVGTSGDELHFGLRDGERYLDPEPLLG